MSVNLEKAAPALDLSQFYGTENYYRHISGNVYTDGVQYFASRAGAYWFVDLVLLEMTHGLEEPFLAVTLIAKNESGDIIVTDGNDKVLVRKWLRWTDCPEGEYTFYICDGVMMLSSEY